MENITLSRLERITNDFLTLDVSKFTEEKNKLTYLSWANAMREALKIDPNLDYKIIKDSEGNAYFGNEKIGYMVYTEVTIEGKTRECWLPVMDYRNKSMLSPTTFDINKAIMRCLTKNLAMFGLGLYIFAGEDLPEKDNTPVETKTPIKNKSKTQIELDRLTKEKLETANKERVKLDFNKLGTELKLKLLAHYKVNAIELLNTTQVNDYIKNRKC